jgi:hypothetical protein
MISEYKQITSYCQQDTGYRIMQKNSGRYDAYTKSLSNIKRQISWA